MSVDWTYEEVVVVADVVQQHGWRSLRRDDTEVTRLSELLRAAKVHPVDSRDDKFRNPAGVARKTADLATAHPDYEGKTTRGGSMTLQVLEAFLDDPEGMRPIAASIREALRSGQQVEVNELVPPGEGDGLREGRLLLALHVKRERNRALRTARINGALASGMGLACEVCGFDFEKKYGARGAGYIEVHHTLPLHVSGEVKTKLEDLALLCANCHRMAHRAPWVTPRQLGRVS
ncbi:HNH endonuclease [Microbacterium rhizosphaerae]|uniref:HNH endonuclease n=1 Tax=Microbacterium rhizosphaerae TaxID=1678237 RepID=A0ABZ0SIV4_9MICO|nr:HNH endonuclease [Microbacterium rhizosphaerae]WPR88735.1 HNH endonuclease [Microbacterium rhizosphaerae]